MNQIDLIQHSSHSLS